jgi:hypothetical protein
MFYGFSVCIWSKYGFMYLLVLGVKQFKNSCLALILDKKCPFFSLNISSLTFFSETLFFRWRKCALMGHLNENVATCSTENSWRMFQALWVIWPLLQQYNFFMPWKAAMNV